MPPVSIHAFLDVGYGADGGEVLRRMCAAGVDLAATEGPQGEAPLHVATRRRRLEAVELLLDHGAEIDALTLGGKSAYAHAARRGFRDVADLLRERGASTELTVPDRLAVALSDERFDEARAILASHPAAARTGNPEEDRLLADMAGRARTTATELLIQANANLAAPGLDSGTPLHQAAWFGEPDNARLLVDAGAPLDVFDSVHESSPLHWAVHGSRYSGGADVRQDRYVALTRMLLEAGSSLHYPHDPDGDAYRRRLLEDASPQVCAVLEPWLGLR